MKISVIPTGSISYVLYETLRAATFMEHHAEQKKSSARNAIQKLKSHFASAYPGSAEEIDHIVAQHTIFVQKNITMLKETGFGWVKVEDQILTTYPQLCSRDTEKLAVLIHLVTDANELHREENE